MQEPTATLLEGAAAVISMVANTGEYEVVNPKPYRYELKRLRDELDNLLMENGYGLTNKEK